MSDIVERLRLLADCDARSGEPLGKAMREAADRIAYLEDVLRPFADWAERWDDGRPGEHRVDARNLASDLRRARAAVLLTVPPRQ